MWVCVLGDANLGLDAVLCLGLGELHGWRSERIGDDPALFFCVDSLCRSLREKVEFDTVKYDTATLTSESAKTNMFSHGGGERVD